LKTRKRGNKEMDEQVKETQTTRPEEKEQELFELLIRIMEQEHR